jgi:DNA polymerase
MKTILIDTLPGFEQWRDAARACLAQNIQPDQVLWHTSETTQSDLFQQDDGAQTLPEPSSASVTVPKDFMDLAKAASCHTDADRFDLLYRVLWRLVHENRQLLSRSTDDDILRLNSLVKNVRRDAYKITAFLRFREIRHEGKEYFIAWHEPEFYTLERSLTFFTNRFRNMRWSILTPYRAAHWDGQAVNLEDNPDPSACPAEDRVEQYWLTYYASTFNPARPKKKAMLSQMPKKYWKNMPETALVEDLLRGAESRAREMLKRGQS